MRIDYRYKMQGASGKGNQIQSTRAALRAFKVQGKRQGKGLHGTFSRAWSAPTRAPLLPGYTTNVLVVV
jgi:hypothetical protein